MSQIERASDGRIVVRVTRTQTRTCGVIAPSRRQPLLAAMLRAFAWLVSNVGSVLGAIFNRSSRDWHMEEAQEVQLPLSNDLHNKETYQAEPSGPSAGSGLPAAFPTACLARLEERRQKAGGIQTPHNVQRASCHSGPTRLAPQIRNPRAACTSVITPRFWVPALRNCAAPAGMTIKVSVCSQRARNGSQNRRTSTPAPSRRDRALTPSGNSRNRRSTGPTAPAA